MKSTKSTKETKNTKNTKNIYQEKGYESREDYLENLSEDYGVCYDTVLLLAELLGEEEDFDGLVTSLEDVEGTIF